MQYMKMKKRIVQMMTENFKQVVVNEENSKIMLAR